MCIFRIPCTIKFTFSGGKICISETGNYFSMECIRYGEDQYLVKFIWFDLLFSFMNFFEKLIK